MNISEFIDKLKSKYLWYNLLGMAGVVVAVCLVAILCMGIYTHHGESIPVPDVCGKTMLEAQHILEEAGMEVEVSDSGYVKNLPADCILEQVPAGGQRVKSGHIIRLTVNASHTPSLVIPDIVDNSSLREAMARLKAMGFRLGMPKFVEGEKDWVYGILANGREVHAGDRVSIDCTLIIMVGNGGLSQDDSVTYVEEESFDNGIITEDDGF